MHMLLGILTLFFVLFFSSLVLMVLGVGPILSILLLTVLATGMMFLLDKWGY
jgi:hypothetical protein